MIRILLAAVALAVLPLVATQPARAQGDAQTLVDRATLAVQDMMSQSVTEDPRVMLERARGILICPRVFKAGFIFAGEGGACVLLARAGNGTWSYPAFYGMGSGSFGFQIGIQDSEVIFIVLTDNGLQALLNSQFKFGADASVAFATIGGGVNGDTTAALRADIVAFAQSRGLFAGVSLEGTLISQRNDWNQSYYGQAFGAQQIVLSNQGQNQGAEPLKEMLAHFTSG